MGALIPTAGAPSTNLSASNTPVMPVFSIGNALAAVAATFASSARLTDACVADLTAKNWVKFNLDSTIHNVQVWVKIAISNSASPDPKDAAPAFVWTASASNVAQVTILSGNVYADINTMCGNSTERPSASKSNVALPSIAPQYDNSLLLGFALRGKTSATDGETFGAPPPNFTELFDFAVDGNSRLAGALVYSQQTTATAVPIGGLSTSASDGTNQSLWGVMVEIRTAGSSQASVAAPKDVATAPVGHANAGSSSTATGVAGQAAMAAPAATVSINGLQHFQISASPAPGALSLRTMFTPNLVLADTVLIGQLTRPGGYIVVPLADGTFWYDGNGDESRQIIDVDAVQASTGRRFGAGYVAINNDPPELKVGGPGFFGDVWDIAKPATTVRLSEMVSDPQGDALTFELIDSSGLPPGWELLRNGDMLTQLTPAGDYEFTIRAWNAYGAYLDVTNTITASAFSAGVTDAASAPTATAVGH